MILKDNNWFVFEVFNVVAQMFYWSTCQCVMKDSNIFLRVPGGGV